MARPPDPERDERPAPLRALDAAARAGYRLGFALLQAWWWLARPTLEGVYVAVWHEGRVLLIRNSYHRRYSFPSGRRGRRERPEDAAVRELREEVGIEVPAARLRHALELRLAFRRLTDHVHLFELHLEHPPELAPDRREVVWAGFEDPRAAPDRGLLPVVARYLDGRSAPITRP